MDFCDVGCWIKVWCPTWFLGFQQLAPKDGCMARCPGLYVHALDTPFVQKGNEIQDGLGSVSQGRRMTDLEASLLTIRFIVCREILAFSSRKLLKNGKRTGVVVL